VRREGGREKKTEMREKKEKEVEGGDR